MKINTKYLQFYYKRKLPYFYSFAFIQNRIQITLNDRISTVSYVGHFINVTLLL